MGGDRYNPNERRNSSPDRRERDRPRDRDYRDRDRDRREKDLRTADRDKTRDRDRDRDRDWDRDHDRDRDLDRERDRHLRTTTFIPTGPRNDPSSRFQSHGPASAASPTSIMGSGSPRETAGPRKDPATSRRDTSGARLPQASTHQAPGDTEISVVIQGWGDVMTERAKLKHRRDALERHTKSRETMYLKTRGAGTEFPSVSELQKPLVHNDRRELNLLDQQIKSCDEKLQRLSESLAQNLVKGLPVAQKQGLAGPAQGQLAKLVEEKVEEERKAHRAEMDLLKDQLVQEQKTHRSELALLKEQFAKLERLHSDTVDSVTKHNDSIAEHNDAIVKQRRDVDDLVARSERESASQKEEVERRFQDLQRQQISAAELEETRKNVETLAGQVKHHDNQFAQIDLESIDSIAEFLVFKQPAVEQKLEALGKELESLRDTFDERLGVVQAFQHEMIGMVDKEIANAGAGLKASENDFNQKLENLAQTFKQKVDYFDHLCYTLDKQYSNLTSREVFEQMTRYFTQVYPNTPRLAADVETISSQLVALRRKQDVLEADRKRRDQKPDSSAHEPDAPGPKRQRLNPVNGHQSVRNGGP